LRAALGRGPCAVMDGGRSDQADTAMAMFVICTSGRSAGYRGSIRTLYRLLAAGERRPVSDVFLLQGVGDELLGKFCGLSMSEQPTDDVAAVDVEDHVEMEAGPFGRALV
jgi:hypothetical protein